MCHSWKQAGCLVTARNWPLKVPRAQAPPTALGRCVSWSASYWDTSAMCLWRSAIHRSSSSSRSTSFTRASPMPLVSYLGRRWTQAVHRPQHLLGPLCIVINNTSLIFSCQVTKQMLLTCWLGQLWQLEPQQKVGTLLQANKLVNTSALAGLRSPIQGTKSVTVA